MPTILEQAAVLTSGDRNKEYGDATVEFAKVATVWSALLGVSVSGPQVALCMAALKLVREAYKHKEDNLVDACGYLHLMNKMESRMNSDFKVELTQEVLADKVECQHTNTHFDKDGAKICMACGSRVPYV